MVNRKSDRVSIPMIRSGNETKSAVSAEEDFTVDRYRDLLRLAKNNWQFATYDAIPWGQNFILWRHDVDYSLNRSLRLARIEKDESVRTTYFVNPHSDFYNLAEVGQYEIVKEILSLGHDLGLHFDPTFYDCASEIDLDRLISAEADSLGKLYGVRLVAFSFHNPMSAQLACEAEYYGGLMNCYSYRFKKEVAYCSDSNGYWRFRRLHDVLSEPTDSCLQVLTHPEWWQETAMPPRQRIFRCAYGRANDSMRRYDRILLDNARQNCGGPASAIRFLELSQPQLFELCDYLWNSGHFQTLFVELWRLHERQINKLCKAALRKTWRVPATEVNAFFEDPNLGIDGWKMFKGVFGMAWNEAVNVDQPDYRQWAVLRNTLIHGRASAPRQRLEDGCVFLCGAIESLATWGRVQPVNYDGINHLGSIGIPTYKTADGSLTDRLEEIAEYIPDFPNKKWEKFKAEMQTVGAGGTAQ